jgi:hypothetical protein
MPSETPGEEEVVPEGPSITQEVVSFSPASAAALKAELGLGSNDLLVGVPAAEAGNLGLTHGETVKVTLDGNHLIFEGTGVKVVTHTPNGDLTKDLTRIGLSKGIRKVAGFKDHRESERKTADGSDGIPDTVTLKVVMVGDKKAVWLIKAGA